MTCRVAVHNMSAHRDGELPAAEARELQAHLGSCVPCHAHWRSYSEALDGLAELPRLTSPESIASRIFDRLDMENRQPGLASLVRSFGARRPLILPSLVPAVLVLAVVLGGALVLDHGIGLGPLPDVHYGVRTPFWDMSAPPAGTETNPLFVIDEGNVPRAQGPLVPSYLLEQRGEGSFFLETVVARDGSVSAVHLLDGDAEDAAPVVRGLRRERFAPVRMHGRPVAVSVYRLISRMEVRPPVT
jgi:hypothetical protein